MFEPVSLRSDPASDLARAVDEIRRAVTAPVAADERDALIGAALRAADLLIVAAAQMLARRGVMEHVLPAPVMLALDGRRLGFEARALTRAAGVLATMPHVADVAARGDLTWMQVRAITEGVVRMPPADRARVDAAVAEAATRWRDASPEDQLARAEETIDTFQPERVARIEDLERERSFLAVQNSFDGRTARLYGEGDAESVATIVQALDSASPPPPPGADEEHPFTRGERRFHALVDICEQSLAGGAPGSARRRPRARLLAAIDVRDLERDGESAGARLLWALTGRKPKLSPLATSTMLCDADVIPVAFDGARPVAVGDVHSPIPPKIRTAVVARDLSCRFPGCSAPLQACDAHHIVWRAHGGPSSVDNLILLCRRCHRLVHRAGWSVHPGLDGTVTFRWGKRRRYVSPPRVRRE